MTFSKNPTYLSFTFFMLFIYLSVIDKSIFNISRTLDMPSQIAKGSIDDGEKLPGTQVESIEFIVIYPRTRFLGNYPVNI